MGLLIIQSFFLDYIGGNPMICGYGGIIMIENGKSMMKFSRLTKEK